MGSILMDDASVQTSYATKRRHGDRQKIVLVHIGS